MCEQACPGADRLRARGRDRRGGGRRHRGGHRLRALRHRQTSSPRASRATASTATARSRTSSTACSSSGWCPPPVRPAGEIRRPSDGKEPEDGGLHPVRRLPRPREGHALLLARSAACTRPSRRCSTSTRCTTGAPTSSTSTSAPPARATTSSARRAIEEDGAKYIRGRVAASSATATRSWCAAPTRCSASRSRSTPTWWCWPRPCRPQDGIKELAQKLSISYDAYGFINEAHPKLRPVETNTAGVFLAGACQAPKDIPDAVARRPPPAPRCSALFARTSWSASRPSPSSTSSTASAACAASRVCPYGAIEQQEICDRDGEVCGHVAYVNPGVCQGCGTCQAVVPEQERSSSQTFTDEQIFARSTPCPGAWRVTVHRDGRRARGRTAASRRSSRASPPSSATGAPTPAPTWPAPAACTWRATCASSACPAPAASTRCSSSRPSSTAPTASSSAAATRPTATTPRATTTPGGASPCSTTSWSSSASTRGA